MVRVSGPVWPLLPDDDDDGLLLTALLLLLFTTSSPINGSPATTLVIPSVVEVPVSVPATWSGLLECGGGARPYGLISSQNDEIS